MVKNLTTRLTGWKLCLKIKNMAKWHMWSKWMWFIICWNSKKIIISLYKVQITISKATVMMGMSCLGNQNPKTKLLIDQFQRMSTTTHRYHWPAKRKAADSWNSLFSGNISIMQLGIRKMEYLSTSWKIYSNRCKTCMLEILRSKQIAIYMIFCSSLD